MVESFDPVYVEHTTEIAKVHGKNVFHSSFFFVNFIQKKPCYLIIIHEVSNWKLLEQGKLYDVSQIPRKAQKINNNGPENIK